MSKNVLLLNDMPGYGRVALSVMMPILARDGYAVYNLPTALVSNTLDFGKYNLLDTTEYMKKTVKVWDELDFSFAAVSVGYIASKEQGSFVREFCSTQSDGGTEIWVDPIMADNGRFYNGMGSKNVEMLNEMIPVADYIVPNYTEAVLLTGGNYKEEGITRKEALEIVDGLIAKGAKSVIITGATVDGEKAVIGYDNRGEEYFILPYVPVRGSIPGTGDVFLALVMGKVLGGVSLKDATKMAMDTVSRWLIESIENGDLYHGIQVEKYL